MTNKHWPAPAKEYAFKLIVEGNSGTAVARMVNARFAMAKSRNAIIGIAYRNGLTLKGGNPGTGGARTKIRKPRKPRKKSFTFGSAPSLSDALQAIRMAGTPLPSPAETDIARISFVQLDEDGHRHCKWPVGNVESIHAPLFCGTPRLPGLSYCIDHARRAYQAPQPRRREQLGKPEQLPAKVLEAA